MDAVQLRQGGPADVEAILAIWDGAVAWLVARGQTGQWGDQPPSQRSGNTERVREWAREPGLTIAMLGATPVGVGLVQPEHAAYVQPIERPETYLTLLLTSRAHSGLGIGARLVEHAIRQAREAGSEILRVDCWAGAPTLVGWYERQGFVRSDSFTVTARGGPWHGQVLELEL